MLKGSIISLILVSGLALHAQEITLPSKAQNIWDSVHTLSTKQWLTDSLSVIAWSDSLRSGIERKTLGNINHLNRKLTPQLVVASRYDL